jgi:hypothetical protein
MVATTVLVGEVAVTVAVDAGAVFVTVVVTGGIVDVSPCRVMVTLAVWVAICVLVVVEVTFWVTVVVPPQALTRATEPRAAPPAIRPASLRNSRLVSFLFGFSFSDML